MVQTAVNRSAVVVVVPLLTDGHSSITRRKLRHTAVFSTNEDWDRAANICLARSNPDLHQTVRCWHGAGRFLQPSQARGDPYLVEARLGGSDAENVGDKIAGRGAAPAVYRRAPPPALAERVVAVDQELLPAAHQIDEQLGTTSAGNRVVHRVAEE